MSGCKVHLGREVTLHVCGILTMHQGLIITTCYMPTTHALINSPFHFRYTTDSYIYKKPGNVRLGFGGNYRRSGEVSPVKSPLSPNITPGGEDTPPLTVAKSPLGEAPTTGLPVNRYEETDLDRPHERRFIEAPQGELPWQKVKVVHTPKMDFLPQTPDNPRLSEPRAPLATNQSDSISGYPSHNMRFNKDTAGYSDEANFESPNVKSFAANFESGRYSPTPFLEREHRPKLDTQAKTKVAELRETILRRSNENLLQAVELSGSRERLNRLSPATSREMLDKLAGSSTNSSQEFKERIENKNSLNLQNQTDSELTHQFGYSSDSVGNIPGSIIKENYTIAKDSQPPIKSPAPSRLEENTLDNPLVDEVFVKHPRQKSQEEMVYEQQAALLASQLKDKDKQLSEVIQPPPERKMSVDYMSGLFKKEVKLNRRPSFLSSRPPGDGSEDVLPPPDVVPLNK